MPLPGGACNNGHRRRDFAFRAITGAVELALADIAAGRRRLPSQVTAALAATLAHVGGESPSPEVVARLCVADRQYLMGRLAVQLDRGRNWYTVRCAACREPFDLTIDHAELPSKEAAEGYPFAFAETSVGRCRFRVPTGQDQEATAAIDDETHAVEVLARLCLAPLPECPVAADDATPFTTDDIAAIERAMEAVAAEVATTVQAACPSCGAIRAVDVDPYVALPAGSVDDVLKEVHTLASAYHWGENEILALPLARRRRYLELIDTAHGVAG